MTSEEKKAYLLLKSIIFHYHGLDEFERENLKKTAEELGGMEELKWVTKFIAEDYFNSFDRAREYLNKITDSLSREIRISFIGMVWEANNEKGYITELEATAMLKLAKDWQVEDQLIDYARKLAQL